jgi:hypothetical protein
MKHITNTLQSDNCPVSQAWFLEQHINFLATKYPAGLLGATILANQSTEIKRFVSRHLSLESVQSLYIRWFRWEEHIQEEWDSEPGLLEVHRTSTRTIRSYTKKFSGVPQSIQHHTRQLVDLISRLNWEVESSMIDLAIFTGLLPWMYFRLDPETTERYDNVLL